jgi:hypothetical protein
MRRCASAAPTISEAAATVPVEAGAVAAAVPLVEVEEAALGGGRAEMEAAAARAAIRGFV